MSNTTLLLVAILVIMVVALPIAFIMKDLLPRTLERSSGLEALQNRIYVLHSEAQDLQSRVADLVARRNQQSGEKHRIDSDTRKIEKQIVDLAAQPPTFVHEIGEPKAGATKFVVDIAQEAASARARVGGDRAAVTPIWRYPNVAEVWANSYDEAKQLVDVAFPFKLGYQKSFRRTAPASPRGAGSDEARKATA
ncbi:hypothetical protein [Azospirillum halopraeferens]|uniref:hypothetical protein n=1 Tax=Azospirillum halopraeferens TaxID=34010 RepID=UPI0004013CB2|nr:hypothetical protein [Azospirillum halopraeferens]